MRTQKMRKQKLRSQWTLIVASCALLSACATPRTQIKNTLVDKGLSEPTADCMAGRMVDRLSTGQLLKIRKLKKFEKKDAGDISANEFVKYTRALQDPEIIGVVSSSAIVCAF